MIKVYDFFSGCGGTSCGLSQAGLEIVTGLDSDRDAASTYRMNIKGASFLETDIRSLSEEALDLKTHGGAPILFCGCAPCQPFSKQNRNLDFNDPRRNLLSEFGRFVQRWTPDYVLVENVPGLQRVSPDEGPLRSFISLLNSLNYSFVSGVLPALWYGVPQTRERFILIASLKAGVFLPPASHGLGLKSPSTVEDWIGELPSIAAGETHSDDPDHQAARLSDLNLDRIAHTPEGGGREAWPEALRLECHKFHKGHSDVYGRLSWKKPAAGLTTRCISYSNGRFGHPTQDRAISVREAASLQTFPDWYKFSGSLASRARQIGNAVPPLMAKQIGEAIISHALQ